MNKILSLPILLLLAVACGSPSESSVPPTSAAQQIARGAQVYAANCASCHGKAGEGKRKAPRLVGTGAFPLLPRAGQQRAQSFHTALDIAGFVTTSMPPDADDRAEMSEQDAWSVLAFALSANGVDLQEPVGPHNAASIVLHP